MIRQFPLRTLSLMRVGPIALLVGPWQFVAGLRARRPTLHRCVGRVYACACPIAGAGGPLTALHASGGPIAGWGFGMLAVLRILTTVWGWQSAVRRRFRRQQQLMRFSYGLTFGAVT